MGHGVNKKHPAEMGCSPTMQNNISRDDRNLQIWIKPGGERFSLLDQVHTPHFMYGSAAQAIKIDAAGNTLARFIAAIPDDFMASGL